MKIGDFEATLMHARVGDTTVALWRVAELARHVDRAALLAADEAPEPPYWAHLWSGAVVLATAVPRGARRVLELGCGLGLPGLTAARRGARVTFVDRVPAALAFVRASARANGLAAVDLVAADATAPALAARFDLVLAAELGHAPAPFPAPARAPAGYTDSRVPAALALVRARARASGLAAVDRVAADATAPAFAARFDLVLAAELVYDRAAFPALARALAGYLAPGGRALLADAGRIDTRAFYAELDGAGLAWRAREEPVREEGLPLTVKLVEVAPRC